MGAAASAAEAERRNDRRGKAGQTKKAFENWDMTSSSSDSRTDEVKVCGRKTRGNRHGYTRCAHRVARMFRIHKRFWCETKRSRPVGGRLRGMIRVDLTLLCGFLLFFLVLFWGRRRCVGI